MLRKWHLGLHRPTCKCTIRAFIMLHYFYSLYQKIKKNIKCWNKHVFYHSRSMIKLVLYTRTVQLTCISSALLSLIFIWFIYRQKKTLHWAGILALILYKSPRNLILSPERSRTRNVLVPNHLVRSWTSRSRNILVTKLLEFPNNMQSDRFKIRCCLPSTENTSMALWRVFFLLGYKRCR